MLKRVVSIFVISLISSTFWSNFAFSEAMVWKVSNSLGELYLGGTIHMLRPTDYPLRPEYGAAFHDSDTIVFETDMSAMLGIGFQQKVLEQMRLPQGQTLKSILNAKTYSRLTQFLEQRGIPITGFDSFKPAMVIMTLTLTELQKIGISPTSGVEIYFSAEARKHKKALSSLETADEQLAVLTKMGEGYENAFIEGSLDDFENLEAEFEVLITAWKNGDDKKIDEKMTQTMKGRFPDMYNTLLVQRNFNWITQIKTLITTPEKEFILVGAAHLAGADSVQNLLRAQGYKVERLTLKQQLDPQPKIALSEQLLSEPIIQSQ